MMLAICEGFLSAEYHKFSRTREYSLMPTSWKTKDYKNHESGGNPELRRENQKCSKPRVQSQVVALVIG